jgi:hypothetical protein
MAEKVEGIALTPKQAAVLKCIGEGMKTTTIADVLGMSKTRVCNIKRRLKSLGYDVIDEWTDLQRAARLPDDEIDAPVQRSEHESEDDEQPDADEPPHTDLQRCQCGLLLPCHHEPIPVLKSAWLESDFDDVDGVEEASIERRRKADRKRKKAQPAGADTAQQPATEAR